LTIKKIARYFALLSLFSSGLSEKDRQTEHRVRSYYAICIASASSSSVSQQEPEERSGTFRLHRSHVLHTRTWNYSNFFRNTEEKFTWF